MNRQKNIYRGYKQELSCLQFEREIVNDALSHSFVHGLGLIQRSEVAPEEE